MTHAAPPLLAEHAGAVLRLTIARPEAANAIDSRVAAALVAALAGAAADAAVGAVVLTGAGARVFCAGRDVRLPPGTDVAAFARLRRGELLAYTEALLAFRKPLVAALNGAAVGAGLMLALHADQVLAVPAATIRLPEIDLAIPPFLGHALLAEVAAPGFANDLALTGRGAGADEALRRGVVHAIVAPERLAIESEACADRLASKPAAVFGALKDAILERRRAAVAAAFARAARLEQAA